MNLKKLCSGLLAGVMILGTSTAFAANGDVYNLDGTLYANAADAALNRGGKGTAIVLGPSKYIQQVGDLHFGMTDILAAFNTDKTNYQQLLADNYDDVVLPGQQLEVVEVSAITTMVDEAAGSQLDFEVVTNKGIKTVKDLAELTEAGYTVEFLATASVFTGPVNKSADGILIAQTANDKFKYQVTVTKEGETIAPSSLVEVTVIDEAATVVEINEIKVLIDTDVEVVSGKLELNDTANIVVMGRTKDMKADADPVPVTTNVKLTSSSNARLSADTAGVVSLNGLTGAVIVTAKAGEVTKTLPLTIVDGARAVKATNSTIDTTSLDLATGEKATVVVMLNDQYGDPIKATVAIATADNVDGDEIATTTATVNAIKTGEAKLTVTADAANAGTSKLEIKVGAVKIGEINVKVTAPGAAVDYKLRLATGKKATVDMKDATPETVINLVGLDKDGLLKETVTKTAEYDAESSDDDIATVAWVGTDITVTGHKKGNATITVERTEGAIVTETYTFNVEVLDTKAVVTGVTFEEDIPKIITAAGIDLAKVVKLAGITVNPDVEIVLNGLDIEEVVTGGNVKIGEIKLTPINAVGFSAPTLAVNKIAVTVAGTATGYVNVSVLDINNNVIGEVDVEVLIP